MIGKYGILPLATLLALVTVTYRPQPVSAGEKPESILIKDVPHVKQKPDLCGEACVEMWLRKLGHDADQDYVFNVSGLDPMKGRGCWTRELKVALSNLGFKTDEVGHKIAAKKWKTEIEKLWLQAHSDLKRNVPSIICMRTSEDKAKATEHFRLVLGYDRKTDEVIYHEPAESGGAYRRMPRESLLSLWPLKYGSEEWTVIRFPLEAKKIKIGKTTEQPSPADYCQRMMELKRDIPQSGFTVILQKPFIVIGDESPARVKRRAERTVKWATDHFHESFFPKNPRHVYAVWLFRDKASYLKHNKLIFGEDDPGTPYGYCSSRHRALIMNIATGGGTLVHEMTHAFMDSNFEQCPSWFNEGMGSLYEQCGEADGRIVGYTNWRLPGLQKAIKGGNLPAFKTLCTTTRHQFYNMDRGTNYGQARYLCYYLQEKGLLRKYYDEFLKNHKADPSGYDSLVKTLGVTDMKKWQKEWEAWTLKLVYR